MSGQEEREGGVVLPEIALPRGWEPMGSAGVQSGGGGGHRAVLGSARLQERQPLVCAVSQSVSHHLTGLCHPGGV